MARALLGSLAVLGVLGVTGLWLATRTPRPEGLGVVADSAPPTAAETPTALDRPGNGGARDEARPGQSTDPLLIVVSSGETGAPLVGARVRWASLERLRAACEARPELRAAEVEDLLEQAGDTSLTDARGEARLPRDDGPLRVSVRLDELFACADLTGLETGPALLELFADRTLAVQVQSTAGHPLAGVPVVVRRTRPGEGELWRGATGVDGLALLPHAQVVLAEAFASDALAAELGFPLHGQDDARAVRRVTFGVDPWPSTPLRLVCPPTGALTVHVRDEHGAPYREPAEVEVRVLAEERDALGRPTRPPRFTLEARDGTARCAYVGLGLQLGVRVVPQDELGSVNTIARGPTLAGEEIELALQLGPRWPMLVGRLLDEHARPLAERRVVLALVSAGRALAREELVTDGEARFRVLVRTHGEPGATFACELLAGATDADVPRAASVALARLAPGELDLGDVELAPATRIAAGVVLDDAQAPVAGASVAAWFAESALDDPRERWRAGSSVPAAVSASDGRFELHGLSPATQLRLVATRPGWADSEPVPVRLGAGDVVLRLARAGSLAGRLLLGHGVTPDRLQVRVVSRRVLAAGSEQRHSQVRPVDGTGAFELEGVGPGLVDVEVLLAGLGRRVAQVEGVFVAGGQVARDARLDPLDLSAALFVYTVRVLDAQHAPVERGHVTTGERDQRGARAGFAVTRGSATLVCTQRVVDVEVDAPGHRTALLRGVDGDREVVLEPALRVRLRLADDVALPPPPLVLHAKLTELGGRPAGDTVQIFSDGASVGWSSPHSMDSAADGAGTFGPSRELTLLVPRPGRHQLVFALSTPGEGDERAHIVPAVLGAAIHVGPEDAARVHTVAPNATRYAEALHSFDN